MIEKNPPTVFDVIDSLELDVQDRANLLREAEAYDHGLNARDEWQPSIPEARLAFEASGQLAIEQVLSVAL